MMTFDKDNKENVGQIAQKAMIRSQKISSQEDHEWTDEEIDELIASYRQSIKKQ